ncbi:MAG: AAA family ATPase [Bacteriovorax sp.]|nr:AAA family ATPase [Bacteriovorax sp.]
MDSITESLKEVLKNLQDKLKSSDNFKGLKTGYKGLDEWLQGLKNGNIIIIGSRPAMGKSSLAISIAFQACTLSKRPVIYFSNQLSTNEIAMRMLLGVAKVDNKKVHNKKFLEEDLRQIGAATKEIAELPIFLDDYNSLNVEEIISTCRKKKNEEDLGLIIIDNLQDIKSNDSLESNEQISKNLKLLKAMARELDCPVIILSQVGRGVEERYNKRPYLADLKDSGMIEQLADVVLFIYREDLYNPKSREKGLAEIIIAKNRHGETGIVKLLWKGSYSSFEELSQGKKPPSIPEDSNEQNPPTESQFVPPSLTDFIRMPKKNVTNTGIQLKKINSNYMIDGLSADHDLKVVTEKLVKYNKKMISGKSDVSLNIILSGPPGSGKTEYAKYLSQELKKGFIFKQASDLKSKWVGEGEKNIKKAFMEAQESKSILFIDEIDTFLHSRDNASQSYQISEVNEFLICLENFKGIFMCATNSTERMDPAALRRFLFKIKFDFLDSTGALKFYNHFYNEYDASELSIQELADLKQIKNLTPSDFNTVKRKLIFEDEINHNQILNLLKQEVAHKKFHTKGVMGLGVNI